MSSTQEKLEEVKEKLAAIEHERWADWQKWMHNQLTPELCIPYELWERWQKQIITPYKDLPEHSKQSDRDQVERYWPIIQALIDSAKREAYKQGYIDAGIKEITEGASKDLFQELLLYKAAYGELPLEQSEESK